MLNHRKLVVVKDGQRRHLIVSKTMPPLAKDGAASEVAEAAEPTLDAGVGGWDREYVRKHRRQRGERLALVLRPIPLDGR